jgi:hypothetical protein
MAEKIMTVSSDEGTTEQVPFSEIAEEGQLHTKFFAEYREEHPDIANLVIEFDDEDVFNDLKGMKFALDRAHKTLGTYVTRINKVVQGIDPAQRAARSASSLTSKDDVGIEQAGENTVHIWKMDGDAEATVSLDGKVETNDFMALGYYIEGILDPKWRKSRVKKFRQFADGVEATPPKYVLQLGKHEVELSDNSEASVEKGRSKLIQELVVNKENFDAQELYDLEPVQVGGGEEWLEEFLGMEETEDE